MSSAFIQRPAPAFKAMTVFAGGEFKEISLSDYLGQWYDTFFLPKTPTDATSALPN